MDLNQTGPVASSVWANTVTMVSDNDPDVIDLADLRFVGMDYGGFNSTYGDILVPSFAMWDDQHTLQPYWSEVDLWVYGDAAQPVVNFNYNYGAGVLGDYPDNTWIVLQVDYNDGGVYLASPWTIYADYNSGYMEWYLPAVFQYITDAFGYEVVSYDWYGTSDYAGAGEFDITKLPFSASPVTSDWMAYEYEPFNEMFSLIFEVDDPDGYELSQPKGVMLVDYHGKPGLGQAYFWPVRIVEAPLFNEFSISTTGTDVEYIELIGTPEVEYDFYTILEIEGDGNGAGYIDEVIAVGTTDANGLWLEDLASNAIENGTVTLLLVKDFTGNLGDDLDVDNDGVLDTEPWSEIVDAVAVYDGDTDDLTYGEPVLEPNYDGLSSFAPGGASRIPDGVDTDTIDDWVRNDFDLAGIPGYDGTPVYGEAYNTPGEYNLIVPFILNLPIIIH